MDEKTNPQLLNEPPEGIGPVIGKPKPPAAPKPRVEPPPEPEAPEPEQEWPLKVKLTKKIHDKDSQLIDTIEFREPTGADIAEVGMPVMPNYRSQGVDIDGVRMTEMMARLASTPSAYIKHMNAKDWTTCATNLQRFFLPDWARVQVGQ